ncbi:MAG: hypothetical protein IPP19_02520 [Verrucomicrobia bacterium]|nr:hypothetical protein [Verrucomicrobiota bacterium]
MADPKLILVTGSTGYVGGRLVPRLLGLIYWCGLYPVHSLIFRGLIRRIAESALRYTKTT